MRVLFKVLVVCFVSTIWLFIIAPLVQADYCRDGYGNVYYDEESCDLCVEQYPDYLEEYCFEYCHENINSLCESHCEDTCDKHCREYYTGRCESNTFTWVIIAGIAGLTLGYNLKRERF